MDTGTDTAFVVSVHQVGPGRATRINLRWRGKHDVGDFDLDRLGTLTACDVETEHTGWAEIEPFQPINPRDTVPVRQGQT